MKVMSCLKVKVFRSQFEDHTRMNTGSGTWRWKTGDTMLKMSSHVTLGHPLKSGSLRAGWMSYVIKVIYMEVKVIREEQK